MNNTNKQFQGRRQEAFTLIEVLTVITIMGIVAALVVTMGQAAAQKKKIVAVQGQMAKLTTMINNYQAKLNYYPPDNPLLATLNVNGSQYQANYDLYAATNPLLYELTGGTNFNFTPPTMAVFNNSNLLVSSFSDVFIRGGVANGDAQEPHDFYNPGPAPKEYASYTTSGTPIYGLIAPVDKTPGVTNNFWHYDSSTTNRHNLNSYDLWIEYYIGTKNGQMQMITNGNW